MMEGSSGVCGELESDFYIPRIVISPLAATPMILPLYLPRCCTETSGTWKLSHLRLLHLELVDLFLCVYLSHSAQGGTVYIHVVFLWGVLLCHSISFLFPMGLFHDSYYITYYTSFCVSVCVCVGCLSSSQSPVSHAISPLPSHWILSVCCHWSLSLRSHWILFMHSHWILLLSCLSLFSEVLWQQTHPTSGFKRNSRGGEERSLKFFH